MNKFDRDCDPDRVYLLSPEYKGTFPVEPGTVPFSNERFEVSGEGKELKPTPGATLGCRIPPMNAMGIEAVNLDIKIDFDGTVHFPDGFEPTPGEQALIKGFQSILHPKLTLERAVEILNKKRHRNRWDWIIIKEIGGAEIGTRSMMHPGGGDTYYERDDIFLYPFEAIAIATAYLREVK